MGTLPEAILSHQPMLLSETLLIFSLSLGSFSIKDSLFHLAVPRAGPPVWKLWWFLAHL